MNREKAERNLKIGLFGAMLTLIGDCLIGAAEYSVLKNHRNRTD